MPKITHATAINRGQFQRLIKITRATSRYAERDVLCLMLGHRAGMRVTEISRITVADVMQPSGTLRREISLREAVTKGCKQRCAYLSSKDLIEALEAYLAYRLTRGIGTELDGKTYREFLPHQPLIYSSRGDGLSQNTKRRVLETGELREYKACDALQAHLTKLYKKAGITGGSSHSGRRTFANRVLENTGDMETVAQLLGHESIDCTQRYVQAATELLVKLNSGATSQQAIAQRAEMIQHALPLLDKPLSKARVKDALRFASVLLRLKISEQFLHQVLRFYPLAHIYLLHGDFGDIKLRESLSDAFAYTLLNCAWPREDSEIDRNEFLTLIEQQAAVWGLPALVLDGKQLERQLAKFDVERLAECMRIGESAQISFSSVQIIHQRK